ncbi:MAG: GNAT family N-acetyltransferase [Burkholderiales bacterium]|nr:GNAT family N-acetyltransferase [Burkholderiales bacterium]
MNHPLDNPVWNALGGPHRRFALGSGRARRYEPAVCSFAAIDAAEPAAYADLARLLGPGTEARLMRREAEALPPGWSESRNWPLLQMVAPAFDGRQTEGPPLRELGPGDAASAVALVELTQPGPFGPRTLEMGRYLGVFEDGELVALSGERMCLDGWVELSAICTHPRVRGRGLAEYLMRRLMRDAFARGQTPFLHVLPENAPAIALYRRLGFGVRAELRYLWRSPGASA